MTVDVEERPVAVDEAEPALDGLDHHVPDALGG